MARIQERGQAIHLRLQGRSYSEIKNVLSVSKGTLHYWLRDYPLSKEQVRALRDWNPRRIENFRKTMQRKRTARQERMYERVKQELGRLNKRELFVAGFFLYWGEGFKTGDAQIGFANTDPAMVMCFIKWLEVLGVPKSALTVHLHLYSDMDIEKYESFWAKVLDIPRSQFRKSYIKDSKRETIKYKGRFGFGTCSIRCYGRDIADYVLMGVKRISDITGTYTAPIA